jgi:acetyl-CoA carboxylase biotin carboxyl carrier protein
MNDLRPTLDALADLVREYGLDEVKMRGEDWAVELGRTPEVRGAMVAAATTESAPAAVAAAPAQAPEAKGPTGVPVSSPMTGIFYASPSPGSPAFAKVGDSVTAGQVVGLIEAMKVFNEITAPASGTVTQVVAKNGDLVNPGEPLLYIG